jgi:hypothetical protein
MTRNQGRDGPRVRATFDANDLDLRLTRIKDLIEELDRLGLKTIANERDYAMASMQCALALKTV